MADALIKASRSRILLAPYLSRWRCAVPTSGTGHAFRCAPFDLRMSRLLRPDESIRVSTGGHVKSDDLSTVVDPVDGGRANALGVIDRREVSVLEDEAVGKARRIYVSPNDLVVIVQSECLRER